MDQRKKEEVADNSLSKARHYATTQNWSRSFPHYLMCFELDPLNKNHFSNEFQDVLWNLGKLLYERQQFQDLCNSYASALLYFPSSLKILNDFSSYLLRLEQPELAMRYLEGAKNIDSTSLLVERNLQTAKLNIIPRWHFRMLNDRIRNRVYYEAIRSVIDDTHNKVLDIGAGCGLLSYYASQCPQTKSITAIEGSSTLANIATNVLGDNVKIINEHSTALNSSLGLSNVLITEIFDAGLFGERVLETLIHAWDNLLEPSAKIVPQHADLYITGINSEAILSKARFLNKLPQLNLHNVCVRQVKCEPYEAENLKQKSFTCITNSALALSVNFNDVNQLKNIYYNNTLAPLTLHCLKSGYIHAIAVWYDLYLTEDKVITTNPFKENVSCWEQAIIHLDHPFEVNEGDDISAELSCMDNKLQIKILDHSVTCSSCFEVQPEIISFLNDVGIVEAAEDLILPRIFLKKECNILDLNPFPIFALFQAKKGVIGRYHCVASCSSDINFLNFVWRSNGFLPAEEATLATKITFEIYECSEIYHKFTKDFFDIIFLNPISKNGTLCEETFNRLPELVDYLKNDGLILPRELSLYVELIDSKYLDICHHVQDENLLGLNMARHLNKYAISEEWQIETLNYPRRTLYSFSLEQNLLWTFPFSSYKHSVSVPINGRINGVMCWYEVLFSQTVRVNTYKSSHYKGICFVFDPPRFVNTGDTFILSINQQNGILSIVCDNES